MANKKNKRIAAIPIAEKVRFWEEQDRINKVLIPRVIRQSELLGKHIAEHDDLPRLFNDSLSRALAKQSSQFKSDLESARTALNQTLAAALQQATADQAVRARQDLDACLAQLARNHERLQAQQAREFDLTVTNLRKEWTRSRNRLAAVVAIAALIAVAAAVSAWL